MLIGHNKTHLVLIAALTVSTVLGSHEAISAESESPANGPFQSGIGLIRGVNRAYTLKDFPAPGRNTSLIWSEAEQNFLISQVGAQSILVDTGQSVCYDNEAEITCPSGGEYYYGQDAHFASSVFQFIDNSDGTVTDVNTKLTWQQTPGNTAYGWSDALQYCESLQLAGFNDWRTPGLGELFSISDFESGWPYLDLDYFDLVFAGQDKDDEYWSSNYYLVDTSLARDSLAFGVNHATGHIKAYPDGADGSPIAGKYVRCVRGDEYLVNGFVDNGDGTVTDNATGLMWMQDDLGEGVDWETALAFADGFEFSGYDDWRLPNVKELQSIVDYSGHYPAIDPEFFNISDIDAYFWTGTSAQFSSLETGYYYGWYVEALWVLHPDYNGLVAEDFSENGRGLKDPSRISGISRLPSVWPPGASGCPPSTTPAGRWSTSTC